MMSFTRTFALIAALHLLVVGLAMAGAIRHGLASSVEMEN